MHSKWPVGHSGPACVQLTFVQPSCLVWQSGPQYVGHSGPISVQAIPSEGQEGPNCVQAVIAVGGWVWHPSRVGQASTADGLH